MDDDRLTDEATGLPPLDELGDDEVLVVLAWASGEGLAQLPDSPTPLAVRYLHARGLAKAPDGTVEWVQVHLAVPMDHAMDVAVALGGGR